METRTLWSKRKGLKGTHPEIRPRPDYQADLACSSLSKLSDDMGRLSVDVDAMDVTVSCGEGRIKAHSIILKHRSPVFKAMLESNLLESKTGYINLSAHELPDVEQMIQFMYTARTKIGYENFTELLHLGDQYDVSGLVNHCGEKLSEVLTTRNALEFGQIAEKYNCNVLTTCCASIIRGNKTVTLDSANWYQALQKCPKLATEIIRLDKEDQQRPRLNVMVHVDMPERQLNFHQEFKIYSDYSVGFLKKEIEQTTNVPSTSQLLRLAGQKLEAKAMLINHNLSNGCIIATCKPKLAKSCCGGKRGRTCIH